jgi:hypothetical protein
MKKTFIKKLLIVKNKEEEEEEEEEEELLLLLFLLHLSSWLAYKRVSRNLCIGKILWKRKPVSSSMPIDLCSEMNDSKYAFKRLFKNTF